MKRDAVEDPKVNVADVDVVLGRGGPETIVVSGISAIAVELVPAPSNAATNKMHDPNRV